MVASAKGSPTIWPIHISIMFLLVLEVKYIPKLKLLPNPRPEPPSMWLPFILESDGEWRLPYEGIEVRQAGKENYRSSTSHKRSDFVAEME